MTGLETSYRCLVTGAAGFIGFHMCKRLAEAGHKVVGVDNLNDYYDVTLKRDRLKALGVKLHGFDDADAMPRFPMVQFVFGDVCNKEWMLELFAGMHFDIVIHLAAQAGVRYSLVDPESYLKNNVDGFLNILECCRRYPVKHLLYASSSSVYGNSKKTPFQESANTDGPVSIYAATKKSNELMAHTYGHLFNVSSTGLRFFTVYGPWGRPDMAYYKFVKSIESGSAIHLYANGDLLRDFTYIDDVTESILRLMGKVPGASGGACSRVVNIGNSSPVMVSTFLSILEKLLRKKARIENKPMQETDAFTTCADTSLLEVLTGYKPCTGIHEGLAKFCNWYRSYYSTHAEI